VAVWGLWVVPIGVRGFDLQDYYSNDPLQLLFGKHRDLENIRWIHFLILGVFILTLILAYLGFLRWRYKQYKSVRKNFPDINYIQFKWIKALASIPAMRRVETLVDEVQRKVLMPEDLGAGNQCWSKFPMHNPLRRKSFGHISFLKFVTTAHKALEEAATKRQPYMRVTHFRSVREYIAVLQAHFKIELSVAARYIEIYELARFGSKPIKYLEFWIFVDSFLAILKAIQTGWHREDKVKHVHRHHNHHKRSRSLAQGRNLSLEHVRNLGSSRRTKKLSNALMTMESSRGLGYEVKFKGLSSVKGDGSRKHRGSKIRDLQGNEIAGIARSSSSKF